jgi:uncharacterized membrane protein YraQ (UPF0718 family)
MSSSTSSTLDRPRATRMLGYWVFYVGLVLGLVLVLLTILDIRRSILFSGLPQPWGYQISNSFGALSYGHAVLGAVGSLLTVAGVLGLRRWEHVVPATVNRRSVRVLALLLFVLLVTDLFLYRGVAATRNLQKGSISAAWLDGFHWTGWWKPVGIAFSYTLTVWHATLLGLLLSGLAMVCLPFRLESWARRRGLVGGLSGTAMAVPQPFCSCCAVAWTPTLLRYGASYEFLLAFIVAAPMVNITTLILAGALLPPKYALLRLVAGIGLPVLVAYAVSRIYGKNSCSVPKASHDIAASLSKSLGGEETGVGRSDWLPQSPGVLVQQWLTSSAKLAAWFIPTMVGVAVIAAAIFEWMPDVCTNSLTSVLVAAVAGTLMMISTWSEIPVVAQLIKTGCSGPAATLLVVLPPVSLPCLAILSACTGQIRLSILLALAVMVIGALVGVLYL